MHACMGVHGCAWVRMHMRMHMHMHMHMHTIESSGAHSEALPLAISSRISLATLS